MSARTLLTAGLTLACATGGAAAQFKAERAKQIPLHETTLYAATGQDFGDVGALVTVGDTPPWAVDTLATTDGGRMLRVFGPRVFVISRWTGTITQVEPGSGAPPKVYALGAASEPVDVHVTGGAAWVTRHFDSRLLRIELASGATTEPVDLSPLALPGETLTLGTLERDGHRLFVQVGLELDGPRDAGPFPDRGVLGVVDLETLSLIDADPLAPGVQGVALDGAPPHLKMQILDEVRRLYVSTTSGFLDGRGGIEIVDLDTLAAVGYALSEEQVADLGGFVMTSPAGGYFVFHTDIVASTHLKPFTIAGGPGADSEMIVLFEVIDALAYDAQRHRIYLPSGNGASGIHGLFAFSTLTDQAISGSPIDTGQPAHDVVLVSD